MVETDPTMYFVLLMLGSGFFLYWRNVPLSFIASIMSQIGILGTFVGIILALWGMDSQNVSDGVPHLLSGMKTAFFSSAVGVFLALILKIVDQNQRREQTNPVEILQSINENILAFVCRC